MAQVKITKTTDGQLVEVDGTDLTNVIKSYNLYAESGVEPELLIEVDVDPTVTYENATLRWTLNLPEEKSIRQAIYQKLKQEFEV